MLILKSGNYDNNFLSYFVNRIYTFIANN